MNTECVDFLRELNRVRLSKHLSVRGAAKVADVPAATMQGWLAGRHVPTPALRPKFQAFVEHLGIPDEAVAQWWRNCAGTGHAAES